MMLYRFIEIAVDHIRSSLWGKWAYSLFTGTAGTLLVFLFLNSFLPLDATLTWAPWVIGFNAMVTGYTLMDATRRKIRRKRIAGIGSGVVVTLAAVFVLNLLSWQRWGQVFLGWTDFFFFTLVGAIFAGLGAALAIRYLQLNAPSSEKAA